MWHYKSAVRHTHDPMLVPWGRNYTCNLSGSASEVVGACCCICIFRFNRYLLEYSAFFCFLIASRLVSAILVVQDVNAILKHMYNTAVRAQLISQCRDGCIVHPPPPSFPHSAPTHVNPRCDDVMNLTIDGVKRFTPAVRHIHVNSVIGVASLPSSSVRIVQRNICI